jgi:hypothetical protein
MLCIWVRRHIPFTRPAAIRCHRLPTSITIVMSSVNQQTDRSIANFIDIFDAASNEYRKLTKQDLRTHTFAAVLDSCDSPDAVLNVFRRQARAFDGICKGDDKLMKWLSPTVNILFTFSAILGEGIALVSVSTSVHSLYHYAPT